jgi:hypothetical protein
MDEIVKLPISIKPIILHYGSTAGFERFVNTSYFIQKEHSDKHIILDVKYSPDNVYNFTDGNAGRCWVVKIKDNQTNNICIYSIRNWNDLVDYYEVNGLQFMYKK